MGEWKIGKIPADVNVEEARKNIYISKLSILKKGSPLFDCWTRRFINFILKFQTKMLINLLVIID